ncbi:MAG TPA: hypothetical protein VJ019_10445 [Aestuariivirga sp.]|nr:hypothetical protein [Aestuariivirga sp.]
MTDEQEIMNREMLIGVTEFAAQKLRELGAIDIIIAFSGKNQNGQGVGMMETFESSRLFKIQLLTRLIESLGGKAEVFAIDIGRKKDDV